MNIGYMYNPEFVLENGMYKILSDFGIQTNHLSARRPDLVIVNKKKKKRICRIVDFPILADHRIKLKKNEKGDENQDLAKDIKKNYGT